jgi:hypothetical protein
MNTSNTNPAPDVAVEAVVKDLMELIDRHGGLRWNAAWDEHADRDEDAKGHDKAAVAVRAQIETALRAALARPQEVAGVTDAEIAEVSKKHWISSEPGGRVHTFAREILALAASRAPVAVGVEPTKLWLWKNFVDGKPEYWAFDNPFPINLNDGDPQTLGQPCGYAVFKPSRQGRTDVSEEQVLRDIAGARPEKVENYIPGWVRLELMVSPEGEMHAIGGERGPGEGDTPYIGLERIKSATPSAGAGGSVGAEPAVCPGCKGQGGGDGWIANENDRSGQSDYRGWIDCEDCNPNTQPAQHAAPVQTRTKAGVLHFLTPEQMADEIIRLDAALAAHPLQAQDAAPVEPMPKPVIRETGQRDQMLDARRYETLRHCRGQEHDPLFCVRDEEGNALWGGDLDDALDEAIAYAQDIYGEDADREALKKGSPALQSARDPDEEVMEQIAAQWDGCMCQMAVVGMVDVGETIRKDWALAGQLGGAAAFDEYTSSICNCPATGKTDPSVHAPNCPARQALTTDTPAPKLKGSPFEKYIPQLLHAAWVDGWACCRDAEYSGDEAMNDRFNQSSTHTLCINIEHPNVAGKA